MSTIKLKKSSVPSNEPSTGDLEYGEIAINFADGKLFYKNSSNVIKAFIDSDGIQIYLDQKLDLSGGTMSGAINMGNNRITNLAQGVDDSDAITKAQAESIASAATGDAAIAFAIALG